MPPTTTTTLTREQRERIQLATAGGMPVPEDLRDAPAEALRDARAEAGAGFRFCPLLPDDTAVQRAMDDSGGGSMEFVASAEVVDRVGDVVMVRPSTAKGARKGGTGLGSDNFMAAGGPLLWAHNRSDDLPPVGMVTASRDARVDKPGGGKVWARIQRAEFTPDEDFPLSRTVANLALVTGSLRGVSIGFVPMDVDPVNDEKERTKMGLGPWGVVFTSSDQLELSMTPTPANPLALGIQGKSAADVVERDVRHGLDELLALGLLSKGAHSDLVKMLLPMDGDTRAKAKVRAFLDVGRSLQATGSWPMVGVDPAAKKAQAPEPEPNVVREPEVIDGGVASELEQARQLGRLEAENDALRRANASLGAQLEGLTADLQEAQDTARSAMARYQEVRDAGGGRDQDSSLAREGEAVPRHLRDLVFRSFEHMSDAANELGEVVDALDTLELARNPGTEKGLDRGSARDSLLAQLARDVGRLTASGAADAAHGPGVAHAGDPVETGARQTTGGDDRVRRAIEAVRALRETGTPAEG